MQNHMENQMNNDMETGFIQGFRGNDQDDGPRLLVSLWNYGSDRDCMGRDWWQDASGP